MRLGVFTPLISTLPLEDVLVKLKKLGIYTVELGTGNYPSDSHCKLFMLDDAESLKSFRGILEQHVATISALSSLGNPLHPDKHIAQKASDTSRKTILLAEKLGVDTVVDFSGCPGDSMFGYNSVLSIEYEDSLLLPEESLRKVAAFLHHAVITERRGSAWWV